MVKLYVPYFEIHWMKLPNSLQVIKEAGFDGVEVFLIGKLLSPTRVEAVRKEACNLGLGIRFHQGWSWKSGQRNHLNWLMLLTRGGLVRQGTSLREQVEAVGGDPVVIYGNLAREMRERNYLYQTASLHVNGSRYAGRFNDFLDAVKELRLPVVFDVQHVLEWRLNETSVAQLPKDRDTLWILIKGLWQQFLPYTKEIHLCDFNPSLGGSRGRNQYVGSGVFPTGRFTQLVQSTNWDGVVVLEVNPSQVNTPELLKKLHRELRALFPR